MNGSSRFRVSAIALGVSALLTRCLGGGHPDGVLTWFLESRAASSVLQRNGPHRCEPGLFWRTQSQDLKATLRMGHGPRPQAGWPVQAVLTVGSRRQQGDLDPGTFLAQQRLERSNRRLGEKVDWVLGWDIWRDPGVLRSLTQLRGAPAGGHKLSRGSPWSHSRCTLCH